ncbi:Ankyrin repeat-containing domain [Trinorchestia longiramus]|nr:Ankyrin repeat-containing domain [Trinorchestia longiramus]
MGGSNKLVRELHAAEQRNDWRTVATLCNALGGELQASGGLQGALKYHQQELEACTILNDTLGVGVAHRRVGEVLCELGETELALQHQQQHLQLATEAGSVLEQQRAYATIGRTQLDRVERSLIEAERQDAINSARDNFLKSLLKCKELTVGEASSEELALMRCRLYLNLGLVAEHKEDAKQAADLVNQAATLARKHSFHEDLYRCHDAMCGLFLKQKKIGLALEESKLAVSISVKLDTSKRVEAQKTLGRIYLLHDNLLLAKRAFAAALKIVKSDRGDVSTLKTWVKAATELCRLDKIVEENVDQEECLKALEKIGDRYALLQCPDKAIRNYQKLLSKSRSMGKSDSELAPIYFSLAKTYEEDKQYAEAKEYYRKEYKVRLESDPKEACKTLLCIALVGEQLGEDREELSEYYNRALSLAQTTGAAKLQVHVLRTHAAIDGLQMDVRDELLRKIRIILSENDLKSDCELTDDESNEESAESDFESSENEDSDENSNTRSRSNCLVSRNIEKVNYFGETPLHKACINGDLAKAKYLVKQGHRINIRDKAGWLPLHEACNHGHLELVKFLLSVGAHINDRGGKECNGITPLHDAASCGNLSIVKLLIEKGASVICKNDDGETPVQCLLAYQRRAPNLSQAELQEISNIANTLKNAMEKDGCVVNLDQLSIGRKETFFEKSEASRSLSPEGLKSQSFRGESSSPVIDASSDEDAGIPSAQPRRVRPRFNAVNRYRSAISELGSATSRSYASAVSSSDIGLDLPALEPDHVNKELKAKRGLIEEDEFVGENDFFEEDVRLKPQKRKRSLLQSSLNFTSDSNARKISRRISPSKNIAERKNVTGVSKQIKLTSMLNMVSSASKREVTVDPTNGNQGSDSDDLEIADSSTVANRQITCMQSRQGPVLPVSADARAGTSSCAGPIRVRVKVEDKVLLVPIADSCRDRTIEWLCSEVSCRYYQLAGIKPTVGLETRDGALLHPGDPITMVLGEDKEELIATVSQWEMPPLHLRYSQDCSQQRVEPCPHVTLALTKAESSSVLELQRIYLDTAQLKLVLRAVQRTHTLHTLSLAHNNLGDEGFSVLLEFLPSLSSLTTLDLQTCGITHESINKWVERLPSWSKCSLSNVNIGYNMLQGCSFSDLSGLLSMPNLTCLNFQHCFLNVSEAGPVKVNENVRTLMLDCNSFSSYSLRQLLMCVPGVRTLSLCGLRCSAGDNRGLGAALTDFLGSGDRCYIEVLDLTFANVSNYDLKIIREYIYRCPFISSMMFPYNNLLTSEEVQSLLTELETNIIVPISTLALHAMDIFTSDLSLAFVSLLQHKFNLKKPLQSVSFRVSPHTKAVVDVWKLHFGSKAGIRIVGNDTFLSVSH